MPIGVLLWVLSSYGLGPAENRALSQAKIWWFQKKAVPLHRDSDTTDYFSSNHLIHQQSSEPHPIHFINPFY